MGVVIDIQNLSKFYGKHRGIEDVTLSVKQGEIFGFLGPNGAGKSTTIRSILGLIHHDSGTARVCGLDAAAQNKEILQRVGYMPSEANFYPSMRVSQVIELAARSRGLSCRREAARLIERLDVDAAKKIEELSLGNRKKVSIICAMQHKPELLLFDEPTSGLDPLMQAEFFKLVSESVDAGATCFLSSHVLSEVKQYCDRAAIIREGRILRIDTIENLTHSNAKRVKLKGVPLPAIAGVESPVTTGDGVEFIYKGTMNALLESLHRQPVLDLLIEEMSLEEIFLHFYTS